MSEHWWAKKRTQLLLATSFPLVESPVRGQDAPPSSTPQVINAADYSNSSLNASTLTLTGGITNSGNIYAVSSNSGVNTVTFSADNISNEQGARLHVQLNGGQTGGPKCPSRCP